MTFFKLELSYFRSFREPQTFWFPRKPGFYFLTGLNKVNPELGRNATGKSSLLAGLVWTLYGKTDRSLSGPSIANWDEASGLTSGSVDLEMGGRYYTLTRTHSPNSLTIKRKGKKPRTIEQKELDRLLGLTHSEFLAVVLMGQFGTFFFDLSPTEKLARFSNVLNLEYWRDQSAKANRLADEVATKYNRYDKAVGECTAKIRVLREQVEFSQKEEEKYNASIQVQRKQVSEQIDQLTVKQLELRKSVGNAVVEKNKADDWRIEQERSVAAVEKSKREATDQAEKATRQNLLMKARLESLEQQLGDAQRGICPTCKQPAKNRDQLVQDLSTQVRKNRTDWLNHRVETGKFRDRLTELSATLDALLKQLRDAEAEVAVWKGRESEARSALKSADASISALLERRREILSGTNPHSSNLEKCRKSLVEAKAERRGAERLRAYHRSRLSSLERAAKEFRNLRLWVVEEALQQLEIEVGNSLMQLGLRDWKVGFDIERATQAGGVSRGFNVFIQAPGSPERVRWEVWCGGETQRLRIAGAVGLANLIRSRSGINPNIEFWDEPTSNLSEEGIVDLLQFFESRSADEKRQVWLIDHRSLKSGNFDGEVRIDKTPDHGSVIRGLRYSYGVQQ